MQSIRREYLAEEEWQLGAKRGVRALNRAFPDAASFPSSQCEQLLPHVLEILKYLDQIYPGEQESVRRALSGQDPQTPQQIIDWLEQTVAGWNQDPTPFVWNGQRRERRQRARLKRLAGSGAAVLAYTS